MSAPGDAEGTENRSFADWKALHGILFFALLIAATFVPLFRTWPLIWIAPLCAYFALAGIVRPLRTTFAGWSFGHVNRTAICATIAIVVLSSTTLLLFQHWMQPDLRAYALALPKLQGRSLVFAGCLFAILNAFLEELIFRGILFTAMKSQMSSAMAVLGSAALFGYGHMHGYPPGALGALLAGVYGVMLGWLRVVTNGLGLPVIAHIFADATIFLIVARAKLL